MYQSYMKSYKECYVKWSCVADLKTEIEAGLELK